MSTIVRKHRFYSRVPEGAQWKVIDLVPKEFIDSVPPDLRSQCYFLSDEGEPFVYDSFSGVIIALNPNLTPDPLTFKNWKIYRLSDERPYILNEYTRWPWAEWLRLSEKPKTGTYAIEDLIYGDKYEIAIYFDNEEYYPASHIRYPERLDYVLGSIEMRRDDEFFKLIFKEYGQAY